MKSTYILIICITILIAVILGNLSEIIQTVAAVIMIIYCIQPTTQTSSTNHSKKETISC